MADASLTIVIKAKDAASAALKKVGGYFTSFKKDAMSLAKEIPGVGSAIALLSNPITAVTAGMGALSGIVVSSVKETMAYTKTIRDLSQNLNITTEETSRLVQTADDYGVSMGAVENAMKLALKNGFRPSIDTLADMADKYNEIQDPTERAATLAKVFGRNWAELTPMLKEGGKAIRETAKAQADNLIVTAESAQAARDNEIAMDAWNDTLQGLKYTIGNELIPPFTKLINLYVDSISTTSRVTRLQEDLTKAIKLGAITQDEYNKIMEGAHYNFWTGKIDMEALAESEEKAAKELEGYINASKGAVREEEIRHGLLQELTAAADANAEAQQRVAYSIIEVQKAAFAQEAIKELNAAYEASTIDAGLYRAEMRELMGQYLDLSPATIEATIRMAELKQQLKDGAIDALQYSDKVEALYMNLKKLDGTSATTSIHTIFTESGQQRTGSQAGRRQHGGPVTAGSSYIVGEAGPEWFVPSQNGRIVPNVTNNFGMGGNEEVIAAIRANRLDEAKLARLMRDQFAKAQA